MQSFGAGLRAGWSAAVQTYRPEALVPLDDRRATWDAWEGRVFRYLHAGHYYSNTAYGELQRYAAQVKDQHGFYHHIRPIYNPVLRLVESYVAYVWGGNLDYDTLLDGAIPLDGIDTALATAIRQVWRWSNWGQVKNRAVRTGANKGDCPIKVVADVARGKVRLEVLDPAILQDATFDAVGNIKAVLIGYEQTDPLSGRPYIYQERIDGDHFATFRDGEPYAYPGNQVNGEPVAEWPNPYGFVPLVNIPHRDMGRRWGGSAYVGLLPKIDELNDQASKTHDYIRVALNPVWYAAGVQGPQELEFQEADTGDEDGDGVHEHGGLPVNVLYGPEGSMVQPMVATADIAAALQAIDRMLVELEKDLPELSLPSIRQHGQMTAPGVRAGFSDAISRYIEARGQYDDGLVRAQQMAISIGAHHGFEGFEPFSLESYRLGNLEHYVAERPVIEDTLSLTEKISALQASGAPAWLIWRLCGLSDDEVEQAWAEKTALERTTAGEFARTLISGALTPVENEEAV